MPCKTRIWLCAGRRPGGGTWKAKGSRRSSDPAEFPEGHPLPRPIENRQKTGRQAGPGLLPACPAEFVVLRAAQFGADGQAHRPVGGFRQVVSRDLATGIGRGFPEVLTEGEAEVRQSCLLRAFP